MSTVKPDTKTTWTVWKLDVNKQNICHNDIADLWLAAVTNDGDTPCVNDTGNTEVEVQSYDALIYRLPQ